MKHAGVRMTITLHHTFEDIRGLVASLARHVPAALERGGEAAKRRHAKIVGEHGPALVLEHHRSAVRAGRRASGTRCSASAARSRSTACRTWSARSAVRASGPRTSGTSTTTSCATGPARPCWRRSSRRRCGRTTCSPRPRSPRWSRSAGAEDPYYLTSMTFGMGSLLTEGDHLYLDRNADWKGALDLLMGAVSEDARAAGAGTIVIRDLHAADLELAEAIRERGYVKTSLPQSLVYEPVDGGDEEWLDGAVGQGAGAPAQVGAAVRRRVRGRVPGVRRPGRLRRRARPPVRAVPGGPGARARPELVPAAEGVPARHALACVVGADDADAEGDRRGRRVRRALHRPPSLRADGRRARLRLRAHARRVPAGAAPGDPARRGRSAPSACCSAWARRSRRPASARTCRTAWRSRRRPTTTRRRCSRRSPRIHEPPSGCG